ncbi:MAG: DNA polymerase/3'-5' exonuclease PolX [Gemmatimonadales bacterium]
MNKKDVVNTLDEIVAYLELKGASAASISAHRAAARAVKAFPGDLEYWLSETGAASRRLDPSIHGIVSEILQTGSTHALERLRREFPPSLVEMFQIPGLGAAKIRQIYEGLKVDSLAELEAAARDRRLEALPRFGKKTAAKILNSIEQLRWGSEARLFHHAYREAKELAAVLSGISSVARVEIAGAVRRRLEIIRGLDFVVQVSGSPDDLVRRLGTVPGVREFITDKENSLSLKFASGTLADIHWTRAAQFGFQFLRATGSVDHIDRLRQLADGKGITWTETELIRNGESLQTRSELDVYRALGLPYIEPELREGGGEIEAARAGTLPTLIERSDIRGFLHCHSTYSDGTSTVPEWARACREAGYEYLGITDHSERATFAGGITGDQVRMQHEEIDAVNKRHSTFRVLKGIEADILEDGSLDLIPQVRDSFEFVIASVHNKLEMNVTRMTARILKAMEDPKMVIWGHPTGRLLLSREPYGLDLDRIFRAAAELGVAIEINADPQRLDLDWRLLQQAIDAGVTIAIGADAHHVEGLRNMDVGVGIARKGWVTKEHVLNTRTVDEFLRRAHARPGQAL